MILLADPTASAASLHELDRFQKWQIKKRIDCWTEKNMSVFSNANCFKTNARNSERLYLVENKWVGSNINYQEDIVVLRRIL